MFINTVGDLIEELQTYSKNSKVKILLTIPSSNENNVVDDIIKDTGYDENHDTVYLEIDGV